VNFVNLTNFDVKTNALPSANSTVVADVVIESGSKYAYVAGGYFGSGSSDIKKVDLGNGAVIRSVGFGLAQTLTAGGLGVESGYVYAVHYSSGDGRLKKYNYSLSLQKNVFLGGMPQALVVKNGDVYAANIDSYSYATNWIDIVPAAASASTRFFIPGIDPVSLALSDDGKTLYVQCAGNNGSICVITNADSADRGIITNIALGLGMSAYGKIRNCGGRIFFTTGVGLYELDTALFTVSQVALASTGVDDIDFDGTFLYLTSDWSANSGYILNFSDLSLYQTVAVAYGSGALYLK
jgi:hypothetical protein